MSAKKRTPRKPLAPNDHERLTADLCEEARTLRERCARVELDNRALENRLTFAHGRIEAHKNSMREVMRILAPIPPWVRRLCAWADRTFTRRKP